MEVYGVSNQGKTFRLSQPVSQSVRHSVYKHTPHTRDAIVLVVAAAAVAVAESAASRRRRSKKRVKFCMKPTTL